MTKTTVRLGTDEAVIVAPAAGQSLAELRASARDLDPLAGVLRQGRFPTNATMLEIAPDAGLSTMLLARAVPAGRVVVFGLQPGAEPHLRSNLEANAISNVHIVKEPAKPSALSLATAIDRHEPRLRDVALVRIAFEGLEPDVLDGASVLIDRENPTIFLAFNAWALNAIGDYSPAAFAKALWQAFEVFELEQNGAPREAPGDPLRFLYRNLVEDGCLSDLVLRKRPGVMLADTGPFAIPVGDARRLQAENAAMRRSTSWRVTKPIRWARHKLARD